MTQHDTTSQRFMGVPFHFALLIAAGTQIAAGPIAWLLSAVLICKGDSYCERVARRQGFRFVMSGAMDDVEGRMSDGLQYFDEDENCDDAAAGLPPPIADYDLAAEGTMAKLMEEGKVAAGGGKKPVQPGTRILLRGIREDLHGKLNGSRGTVTSHQGKGKGIRYWVTLDGPEQRVVNVTSKQFTKEQVLKPPWEDDNDPQVKLRGYRNIMSDKVTKQSEPPW